MDRTDVQRNIEEIARGFAEQRAERQLRRHLDRDDFAKLADAGFLLTGVPSEMGGLWTGVAESTRTVAELLRTLARADGSVALVSSMHPAVLSFWLCQPEAPEQYRDAWAEQSRFAAQTALDGAVWGTITSEPGSGGDVGKTKTLAQPSSNGTYAISGQKHFGSGSGVTSYMITTARPEDEAEADWFFMDVRDAKWDGSNGITLVAEWDGHGMAATQSHAFEFSGYPATRMAWPGNLRAVSGVAGAFISSLFTGVVVGVAQSAFATARAQLLRKKDTLRPYELTEWARAENEAWTIDALYESLLRAVEAKGPGGVLDALHAKTAIAELAESMTQRLCRVIGGGSFHRSSPLGWAFEDVRALGFLRPPWGLAYETLIEATAAVHGG